MDGVTERRANRAGGAAVEAESVSRHFGGRSALEDVTLSIRAGERFGLLGANGAGKTTFIRLVTGYLEPSAGSLRVDGLSPSRHAHEVRSRIGCAAETPRLYSDLRVEQFLRFCGALRQLRGEALHAAVAGVLERFQLRDVATRLIGNLSKGYQQRVSLAQAFLHDPALLIVDEPTAGLDPLQQAEVRRQLLETHGGRTLLLCTHDLAEARELTERVAVLHAGRLVAVGATTDILGGGDTLLLFRAEHPSVELRP